MTNISYAKVGWSDVDAGDTKIAFLSSYWLTGGSTSTVETVRLTTLGTLVSELGLTLSTSSSRTSTGSMGKCFTALREHWRDTFLSSSSRSHNRPCA